MVFMQGKSNTVSWVVKNNELIFYPTNRSSGTFENLIDSVAKPWNSLNVDLIRFEKGCKAPSNARGIFAKCKAKKVDLTNLDFSETRYLAEFFSNAATEEIIFGKPDFSNVRDLNYAFNNMDNLKELNLIGNMPKLNAVIGIFDHSNIETINIDIETPSLIMVQSAFARLQCKNLNIKNVNVDKVTSMEHTFFLAKIDNIKCRDLKLKNLTTMSSAFHGLETSKPLDFSNIHFGNKLDVADGAFAQTRIKYFTFDNIGFTKTSLIKYMFDRSTIETLDISNLPDIKFNSMMGLLRLTLIDNLIIQNNNQLENLKQYCGYLPV